MQIYITRDREKQLRDYALRKKVSMSSVIDKSLDLYINKNGNDKPIPPLVPSSSPIKLAPVKKGNMEFEL